MERHYMIGIQTEHHMFEYRCSTISEAYDAIQDAIAVLGIEADLNGAMMTLVDMERGNKQTSYGRGLWLSVEKGEV